MTTLAQLKKAKRMVKELRIEIANEEAEMARYLKLANEACMFKDSYLKYYEKALEHRNKLRKHLEYWEFRVKCGWNE